MIYKTQLAVFANTQMDFPSFLETTISGAAFGFTAVVCIFYLRYILKTSHMRLSNYLHKHRTTQLLAHPFDTVKTRQQVWSGTLRNKNLFNSLKPASFKGLYQGISRILEIGISCHRLVLALFEPPAKLTKVLARPWEDRSSSVQYHLQRMGFLLTS